MMWQSEMYRMFVLEYAEFSKDLERPDWVVKVVSSHREVLDFQSVTKGS